MASNVPVDAPITSEEPTEALPESVAVDGENEVVEVELSATDRFQQRLDRFGKIAPEAKKASRALRFGTPHEAVDDAAKKRRSERFGTAADSTEDQQDKKRQRAERFHADTPTPTSTVNEETKQKRIDRFGIVTPSTPASKKNGASASTTTPVLTDAIKKRAERFGDVSQVAKSSTMNEQKAKRAERFKPVTSV